MSERATVEDEQVSQSVPTVVARTATPPPDLPDYLKDNYWWAYLRPASIAIFDRSTVVSAILWGQYNRLKRAAFTELKAGQNILQAACVYGDFSVRLAEVVGPHGKLEVVDIAPIQVNNCRRKLHNHPQAQVTLADASVPGGEVYDGIVCFFLLHELPDDHKRQVVDGLLERIGPEGKVVFVDYHGPHWLHPLRGPMSLVCRWLEPFAKTLWRREISSFATRADSFAWRKKTFFGGLYQHVVATRLAPVGRVERAA